MIARIDVAVTAGATPARWRLAIRHGDVPIHDSTVDAPIDLPDSGGPIAAAIAELRKGSIAPPRARALGAHLFTTFFAPAWPAILARVPAGTTLIELALDLDDLSALPLRAVPWELMASAEGWLAGGITLAGARVDVAITRRTARAPVLIPALAHPLRYLFVIGTSLGDQVRAGAECLGLLRQIAPVVQERIVQRQSLAELRAVIAAFDPHVIHVICHGRELEGGGVQLELWDAARNEPSYVSGAALADAFVRTDDKTRRAPAIAVLSACSTGDRLATGGADLARTLVNAGVPMVIGMAAEIRDQACRLFARNLGVAIGDRSPLIEAATRGRRIALADPAATRGADWALVQVMLGHEIDAAIAVEPRTPEDDETNVLRWLDGAALPLDLRAGARKVPPLVGGDDLVDSMYRLIGDTHAALIVLACPPQDELRVGSTRAFAELAAAAIRAGHVPIIAMRQPIKGAPRSPREVIEDIRDAVVSARTRHKLGTAPLALDELLARGDRELKAAALADALEQDCGKVQARARDLHPTFIGARAGRALLMLHDVHAFGDGAWLVLDLLTARGAALGEFSPTIVSWTKAATDTVDGSRKILDEALATTLANAPWIETLPLVPLAPIDDKLGDLGLTKIPVPAKLALQRILLNPFLTRPPQATRGWFLDLGRDSQALDDVLRDLIRTTDGCCLGQFASRGFGRAISLLSDRGAFDLATDDDLLGPGGRR